MFSKIRGFLSRHRRKFMIGGVLIGGTVVITRYVLRKIQEQQDAITRELIEQSKRQVHFQSIEKRCNETAITLSFMIKSSLSDILNCEELAKKLNECDPTQSIPVFKDLKISTFTKAATIVYANSLLMVILRIQFNLMGGYDFRSVHKHDEQPDRNLNGKYLSLCEYIYKDGLQSLKNLVEACVSKIMKKKSLRDLLTLSDVEQIFWSIQSAISNDVKDPAKNLPFYLLPAKLDLLFPDSEKCVLSQMIVETLDLLESEDVSTLFSSCVSQGFSHLIEQIALQILKKPDETYPELASTSIELPKLILLLVDLHKKERKFEKNQSWIEQLIASEKLRVLGANVYDAFSH